jgi:hypothetical protein
MTKSFYKDNYFKDLNPHWAIILTKAKQIPSKLIIPIKDSQETSLWINRTMDILDIRPKKNTKNLIWKKLKRKNYIDKKSPDSNNLMI